MTKAHAGDLIPDTHPYTAPNHTGGHDTALLEVKAQFKSPELKLCNTSHTLW